MDVQLTWTDCDEAGDYIVPNVLSPRDLVSRRDKMDKTVLHTHLGAWTLWMQKLAYIFACCLKEKCHK